MNRRQLRKLGVPEAALDAAVRAVSSAASGGLRGGPLRDAFAAVLADPDAHAEDRAFGPLVAALRAAAAEPSPREPIPYRAWEAETQADAIDPAAHAQMRQACAVPSAVGAALMPDAHVGYGLPIGGVLACENAVIPYAVGVDIACRMKLSVLDTPVATLADRRPAYREALERGSRFGVGVEHERRQSHDVMDRDWSVTRVTREKKDTAWRQLGTT